MKRSEMILNIQIEIAPLFNTTDSYTRYQYAENILKMIEENGMMPPEKWISESGNEIIYEWEEE